MPWQARSWAGPCKRHDVLLPAMPAEQLLDDSGRLMTLSLRSAALSRNGRLRLISNASGPINSCCMGLGWYSAS